MQLQTLDWGSSIQKSKILALGLSVLALGVSMAVAQSAPPRDWPQWGQNSQHDSFVSTAGQDVTSILTDTVYDPFTAAEERDTGGDLLEAIRHAWNNLRTRQPDGTLSCVSDRPNGFEWCINAPVINGNNNVYVESEDVNIYKIPHGQHGIFDLPPKGSGAATRLFLRLALGAAYTPFSIDELGRLCAQNAGHLFVSRQLSSTGSSRFVH